MTLAERAAAIEAPVYVFAWGGIRAKLGFNRKGQRCRVVARLPMNSALVEWETGGRDIISRNALRKARLALAVTR